MSVHKMNPEVKSKWVAALRSGEYKQGTHWLRKPKSIFGLLNDEFCCLGVLCNLHAQEHPELAATQKYSDVYFGAMQALPREVREWAGLKDADPYIGNGKAACVNISYLNDNGWSFTKIADAIEKQF